MNRAEDAARVPRSHRPGLIPETRPEARRSAERKSMAATFAGHRRVLADGDFAAFQAVAARTRSRQGTPPL